MNIKCPHCNKQFSLDSSDASEIISQVRTSEFESEVNRRVSSEVKVAVMESKQDSMAKISDLQIALKQAESEKELAVIKAETALRTDYEAKLRDKQTELDYYKDFKTKQSTKMVGESLERYCSDEFNKVRMMAFPNAYFEKDNEVSKTGSKGDFVYREFDEEGVELLSIMFEMKNEMDTTEKKHKNEDFFKELDKDRKEKNCEYAILVSLLEVDSPLYNQGIVDVSYKYDKMYVVRPQFFIAIISVLRNAALASLETKRELQRVRNQNIDITNFEAELNKFKDGFAYNYTQASKRFNEAIDEIDKTIAHLQKVKDALTNCDRQLRLANDKADGITIKRLCRNNPTMSEKFKELRENGETNTQVSDLP